MTLDIDKDLLEKARKLSEAKSKKELINLSLREFIRHSRLVRLGMRYGQNPLNLTLNKLYNLRAES